MRILVFGRNGQLARSLAALSGWDGMPDVTCLGRADGGDVTDPAAVAGAIAAYGPDAVVNAAAYTAVDRAETDEAAAHAVNAAGARHVAEAAAAAELPLVHLSTDYVFDGTLGRPCREDDPTSPPNAYGRSKLSGEEAVRLAHAGSVVLRTAWLFSPFAPNFAATILQRAREGDRLAVVDDQWGNPTCAGELARAVAAVAGRLAADADAARGTFHFAGPEALTWCGFARRILAAATLTTVPVEAVASPDRPAPAKRPVDSRLDSRAFEAAFGRRHAPLDEALRDMLAHRPDAYQPGGTARAGAIDERRGEVSPGGQARPE